MFHESALTIGLSQIDRVFSSILGVGAIACALYFLALDDIYFNNLKSEAQIALISQIAASTSILLYFVARLVGRFGRQTVEKVESSKAKLPAIFFNFEKFGTTVRGILAGQITTLLYLLETVSWLVTLFVSTVKMTERDRYATTYELIWIFFLIKTSLSAIARCVTFDDDTRSWQGEKPTPRTCGQNARSFLILSYIFLVFCVVDPFGCLFIFYFRRKIA